MKPEALDAQERMRAVKWIDALYKPVYDAVFEAGKMGRRGSTSWADMYSERRTRTVQCDFCYESLTPPPYGDTDPAEALVVFGPGSVLSGNIDQIEFLMKAGRDEIASRVHRVLAQVRDRPLVLATTDCFHEQTPHDNIHTMADAALASVDQ